jgi:glycine/D-amino acid oxidase-like deaminating enzyme
VLSQCIRISVGDSTINAISVFIPGAAAYDSVGNRLPSDEEDMTAPSDRPQRVVIVGGGIAGLSAAVRLAQAGLPVLVAEAGQLGAEASTRNQGWLHSGGYFARSSLPFARMCRDSLEKTIRFCPECLEPNIGEMLYLISRGETSVQQWTTAWNDADIPAQEVPRNEILAALPGIAGDHVQHGFRLPNRATRVHVLLQHLAAAAENAGAEIRTGTPISRVVRRDERIEAVVTGTGEEIPARLVVMAPGTAGAALLSEFLTPHAGEQADYELVPLKTHLLAIHPRVAQVPFCVVDEHGLNHIPHDDQSIFGIDRWETPQAPNDHSVEPECENQLWQHVGRFFPGRHRADCRSTCWSGTMFQAMRLEQVQPGNEIWPAVIDHSRHTPRIDNLLTIFTGRATLWPKLAEETRKLALAKLDTILPAVTTPPWGTS